MRNGACGNTVPVPLYTNALVRFVNDPGTLGLGPIGVFGVVMCFVIIVAIAKNI